MDRLYPAHFEAIAEALGNIFTADAYADREIARVLKADKRRGSKDRAFIAEQTYEVVRNYRLLRHLAGGGKPKKREDFWRLIGIQLHLQGRELPAWREFGIIDAADIQAKLAAAQQDRALRESIPDWLDAVGEAQLGAQWTPTLAALNEQAPVVLRANRLKTTPAELSVALARENVVTTPIAADALLVTERQNLFTTKAFQQGLFEVQDFSSQQAAPSLEVSPGQTVIDACAGAGGKSLHLAALLENRGQLISLDIHGWKLEELKKRARRNGVSNLETRAITSSKVIKRLAGRADRVLLDVPCSGLGVLRRNPDAKWKLSQDFIDRVVIEQAEILSSYSRMVKPGGKLVYATCSILPRENDEQVAAFLGSPAGEGWTLEHQHTFLPQVEGYDGFFLARLVKG
ncbi:RsmB/NOP family class I SAM-dependent RNA methyltransferase [Neolewinella lacunae]|uniref:RsmB/NOP family class I SAM-dependent RNA methyltransferase n=1 Tax=Neolewinella lacunae TaxID=1517758 RepID=A0A923PK39_9BACT|nr:RsmB/NOP family class I SAM-dependent RNA methyltransferase [Neolewinella lacunae]MBC6994025.1 RsmB/NOP family class I SAM-dependent RNA methyltransferase [Neolewinella lacunae]MDN3634695.1 RsmB/NOP family class I SAM-dependent RNA methyltransferase [Neolewinella lacunae]